MVVFGAGVPPGQTMPVVGPAFVGRIARNETFPAITEVLDRLSGEWTLPVGEAAMVALVGRGAGRS